MKSRRIISFFLVLTLVLSLSNGFVFSAYAESDSVTEAIPIEAERLPNDNIITDSVVYMGTSAVTVPEDEALYSLTVYRDGDTSQNASVEVKTHDLTAVYGEDYEIVADNISVTGDKKSILQKSVESNDEADEDTADSESRKDYSSMYEDEFGVLSEQFLDSETENDSEKSSLAILKEEQTGEKTRETYRAEYSGLSDSVMQSIAPEIGNTMESSSSFTLDFMAGESEKTIMFKILADEISESNEGFSITLNNPVGADVYGVTATAVTIEDDEPVQHSSVSFKNDSFKAKDGKVEVTIVREGAEYSLAEARLKSMSGTAKAGENYIEQNSLVAFMPYETEKTISLSVSGSGEFELSLSEFKSCTEGEITRAKVIIKNEDKVTLLADDKKSFSINISGKEYKVKYDMKTAMGTIVDESYTPPLEVGNYYFSSDSGHGGIFEYGKYGGSKPWGCGTRESKYQYKSDSDMSQNYGSLKYYNTSTWKKGYSYTESSSKVPGVYYQYMVPDWKETSNFGSSLGVNPQISRFELYTSSGVVAKGQNSGEFSRSQDKGFIKLENKNQDMNMRVLAVDEDGGRTPKSYVEFYGVAAMYKKYTISVESPSNMTYKNGNSTFDTLPAQVKTASGANVPYQKDKRDIYANTNVDNSNIVFEIIDGEVNGSRDKFGNLIGYTIKVDSAGEQGGSLSLNYPNDFFDYLDKENTTADLDYSSAAIQKVKDAVKADLRRIPTDAYFIDWLDNVGAKNISSGNGYYKELKFKPLFEYNNVQVRVEDSIGGVATFDNPDLSAGSTLTYHAGDSIDLEATPSSVGQHIVGYEVSCDGGVNFDLITSNNMLLLSPNKNYIVRPRVADNDNRIEIQFEDTKAKEKLTVLNLIDESLLKDDLAGRHILKLNSDASDAKGQMDPTPGEVYGIQIIAAEHENSDYVYRPVIKTKLDDNTYKTQYFDYIAKSNMVDNIITIGVEEVKKSDLKYYSLEGSVLSDFAPIRSTGVETSTFPVTGYTLFSGGSQEEFLNSKTNSKATGINRITGTTGDKGEYVLSGIKGMDGDIVTVLLTNGSDNQVCTAVLSSKGLSETDITRTYNEIRTNEDTKKQENYICTETVKGYKSSQEPIMLSYPTTAPCVTSIMYSYDDPANVAKVRLTDNGVRMFDDTLNITAVVNTKGREISKAIFTVYTVTGIKREFESTSKNGDSVFNVAIENMLDVFHNGDKIYVRLVDAEKNEITNTTVDEETGVETTTKSEIEISYPDVDTGLITYVENELVAPKTYDMTNTPTVNIPLLGNTKGNAKSDVLSFTRSNWSNNMGYTLTLNINGTYATAKAKSVSSKNRLEAYKKLSSGLTQIENNRKEDIAHVNTLYKDTAEYMRDYNNNHPAAFGDKDFQTLEEQKQRSDEIINGIAKENGKKYAAGLNKQTLSVNAFAMLGFEFVYDPVRDDYMFVSGTVCIGTTVSYQKTMYSSIYGIPVYLQIGGTLQLDFPITYNTSGGRNALTAGDFNSYSGNIAEALSRDTYGGMELMISGKVQAGVGMCGVIGARGYVTLAIQTAIIGDKDGLTKESGFLFSTTGGIAIDLLVTSIDINLFSVMVGVGAYSSKTNYNFFGGLVNVNTSAQSVAAAADNSSDDEILEVRSDGSVVTRHDYSYGSDDMSDFGTETSVVAAGGYTEQSITTLLSSAAERTRPKIVDIGDGNRMIVFIASNIDADEYNKPYLMYSIQRDGVWSQPKPISQDNTQDTQPDVLVKNNKVYIAWADSSRAITKDDDLKSKLMTFGISVAVYDIETDTLSQEITLTMDDYLNSTPQLNVIGDKIYCNYMKRDISKVETDQELLDLTNIYSTMAYRSYDFVTGDMSDEKYITISHESLTDPLVFDYREINAAVLGNNYMLSAYTIDEDLNLNTDGDRELYLKIYNLDSDKGYYPIKLSSDFVSQSAPRFACLNDEILLTWIEDGYLFKMMNVTDLLNSLIASSASNDEDSIIINNSYINSSELDTEWYKKSASEIGVSDEDYSDSIYKDIADGDFRVYEKNFKGDDEKQSTISSYKLVTDGDDLYIFYTDFGSEETGDTSVELYGAKYERYSGLDEDAGEDEAKISGWSDSVKITNYGKVIDEFDIIMDEDGKAHGVSNYYTQSMGENGKILYSENKLVAIDFGVTNSLEVSNISFTGDIIPDEKVGLTFDVFNNGLLEADGYDITVKSVKSGIETVIYSENSDNKLDTGEKYTHSLTWEVPDDVTDTKIVVEVKENNTEGEISVCEKDVLDSARLNLSDLEIKFDNGEATAYVTVKNSGSKASESYEMKVIKDDDSKKEYTNVTIEPLAPGETREYALAIEIAVEDFDEHGMVLIKAVAYKGDEEVAYVANSVYSNKPIIAEINGGDETIEMDKGATVSLSLSVAPWSSLAGEPKFYSQDSTVVNVSDSGEVYALNDGVTKIGVYYPNAKIYDTILVKVGDGIEPTPTNKPSSSGGSVNSGYSTGVESEANPTQTPSVSDDTLNRELPFIDVSPNSWYYDGVKNMYDAKIMNGTSENTFEPDGNLTRGMFVTMLHRYEGEPQVDYIMPFGDIDENEYYAEAVRWAASENIVNGVSDTEFAPDDFITREQMAKIVLNYYNYKGKGPNGAWAIRLEYTDLDEISEWAADAVMFCTMKGIIEGNDDKTFNPQGNATRAEAAVIMNRIEK